MDLNYLRQANIFGNQTPRDPYQGVFGNGMESPEMNPTVDTTPLRQANFGARPISPQEITSEPDDFAGYTPEHTATDRYNQLVGQYPAQDHPGILRRIAAMAAGLGGPNPAQEQILHGARNTAIADWENQIKPAESAANLERYANALRGTTAYRGGQLDIAKQKADTQDKNVDSQVQARANRGDYLRWQMTHPNHELKLDEKTGHMIGFNPKNLSEPPTDLGEFKMSQQEFADMNFEHNKILADIKAEQTRTTNAARIEATAQAKTEAPLAPSQDQILTNEAYANWIATGQPESDKIVYNKDSKTYDTSQLTNKQALATYVKNYKAKFNASRGGTRTTTSKPAITRKASEVPAAQRKAGESYLMGDGKTTKTWTGNLQDPWK